MCYSPHVTYITLFFGRSLALCAIVKFALLEGLHDLWEAYQEFMKRCVHFRVSRI